MESLPEPSEVNEADRLSYLLIELDSSQGQQNAQARVFSNGVQKCAVLITLQARNANGEVVTIADDSNVNVVEYTSSEAGWWSNADPSPAGVLPFPETMIPYVAGFDNGIEAEAVSLPQSYQQFRRYVSYDDVPDGTVIQFAAKVKLSGVEYVSNQRDVPYGGAGEGGRFNSSFRLKSVQPLRYTVANGGLLVSDPTEVFSGLINGFTAKVQNTYMTLRYPGSTIPIAILPGSSTAADSSLHENKATAFGDPGSAVAKKNIPATDQLGQSLNQALATIRQPRPGAIAVAVAMYARIVDFFPVRQISRYDGAMDVYGNPLRFTVELISDRPERNPWVYQLTTDSADA
ncbi:hypothetical protein [Pseudomonas glycinae]|uniref:hypothetical protein n=1 Tax=Pseudomonas glycinae TaxID=1785145 RepID=UPI001F355DF7|nr:hypothetical protein [Pseudomonas glycinae]